VADQGGYIGGKGGPDTDSTRGEGDGVLKAHYIVIESRVVHRQEPGPQ
jgi:hypothetical protein